MRQEGSSLLIVIIFMTIITIATSITILINNEVKVTTFSQGYVKSLYIAEGALDFALSRTMDKIIQRDHHLLWIDRFSYNDPRTPDLEELLFDFLEGEFKDSFNPNIDGEGRLLELNYSPEDRTITILVKGVFEEDGEVFERKIRRTSRLNLDFFNIFDNAVAAGGDISGNSDLKKTQISGVVDEGLEDLPYFDFESYRKRAKLNGVYEELKGGERQGVDSISSKGEYTYLVDKSETGLRLNARGGRASVDLTGTHKPRVMVVEGDLTIEGGSGLNLDNIYFVVGGKVIIESGSSSAGRGGYAHRSFIYAKEGIEVKVGSGEFNHRGLLMTDANIIFNNEMNLGRANLNRVYNEPIDYEELLGIMNINLLEEKSLFREEI